jgi:hypothetical protein
LTEDIREEIKKSIEYIGKENTTYQSMCDIAKAILRGNFIALSEYT